MGYGNRGGRGRKQYDNNMSACLFRNEEKRGEKDPSWKGSAEVDGREYWVAGWVNENPDGSKRINLKFTEKEDLSPQQRNARRGGGGQQQPRGRRDDPPDDDLDDIPF